MNAILITVACVATMYLLLLWAVRELDPNAKRAEAERRERIGRRPAKKRREPAESQSGER